MNDKEVVCEAYVVHFWDSLNCQTDWSLLRFFLNYRNVIDLLYKITELWNEVHATAICNTGMKLCYMVRQFLTKYIYWISNWCELTRHHQLCVSSIEYFLKISNLVHTTEFEKWPSGKMKIMTHSFLDFIFHFKDYLFQRWVLGGSLGLKPKELFSACPGGG